MRAILFDLDNTLTDRNATIVRYAEEFVESFADRLLPGITPSQLARVFLEADGGGYEGHEKRSRLISEERIWRHPSEPEMLSEHWKSWIPNNPEPMAGLHPLLDWLATQPIQLGMITNGSSLAQRRKIEKLGLARHFDAIVVSEEVGIKKPDRRIFELAAGQLGATPSECVFVGDDPTNDYHGALHAGMTPIWFEGSRPWLSEEPARIEISSLQELPEILGAFLRLNAAIRYLSSEEFETFRRIRLEALETDPDAFGALYADAFRRTDEEWEHWVGNAIVPGRKNVVVAEEEGRPIGMCGFGLSDEDPETGFLWGMFVSREHRRKRCGEQLLKEAEHWLSANGANRITACVAAPNEGAIRFYRRNGYTIGPASGTLRPGSSIPIYPIEKQRLRP